MLRDAAAGKTKSEFIISKPTHLTVKVTITAIVQVNIISINIKYKYYFLYYL